MIKRFIAIVICSSMLFSNIAYAGINDGEAKEHTAQDVALLITSLDKKPSVLPDAIWIGGGAALLLGSGYAMHKILTNPEIGKYFIGAVDPMAYQALDAMARTKAERASIESSATLAKRVQEGMRIAAKEDLKLGKQIMRKNYWQIVRNSFAVLGSHSNEMRSAATSQLHKSIVNANEFKTMFNSYKVINPHMDKLIPLKAQIGTGGKVMIVSAAVFAIGYLLYGDEKKDDVLLSNSRNEIERYIRSVAQEDPEALLMAVYNLGGLEREIACDIIARDARLYEIIVHGVEFAKSNEHLQLILAAEKATKEVEKDSLKTEIYDGDTSVFMQWHTTFN